MDVGLLLIAFGAGAVVGGIVGGWLVAQYYRSRQSSAPAGAPAARELITVWAGTPCPTGHGNTCMPSHNDLMCVYGCGRKVRRQD